MATGYIAARRAWPGRRTSPLSYSQDELRQRRRAAHIVAYTGDFDLAAEVEAMLTPVAESLATEPAPGSYTDDIEIVADAVHALVVAVAQTVTTRESRQRLDGLSRADRDRAKAALVALSRPEKPIITRSSAIVGSWPTTLTEMAAPYAQPLAVALGAVAKTADGEPSPLSNALVAELKDVDRAVLSLTRRIARAQSYRDQNPRPAPRPSEADEHRKTLQELGIEANQ